MPGVHKADRGCSLQAVSFPTALQCLPIPTVGLSAAMDHDRNAQQILWLKEEQLFEARKKIAVLEMAVLTAQEAQHKAEVALCQALDTGKRQRLAPEAGAAKAQAEAVAAEEQAAATAANAANAEAEAVAAEEHLLNVLTCTSFYPGGKAGKKERKRLGRFSRCGQSCCFLCTVDSKLKDVRCARGSACCP